jgi:hypothetical protein
MHSGPFVGQMKKWSNTQSSCPSTSDVWSCGPKKLQKAIGDGLNFLHVVEDIEARCELAEIELMAMIARKVLWFQE